MSRKNRPAVQDERERIRDGSDPDELQGSYEVAAEGVKNFASDGGIAERAKLTVRTALADAGAARQQLEQRWLRFYRLYRSVSTSRSYKGRANLFVPKTYGLITKTVPRVVRRLFGEPKWFAMEGVEETGEKMRGANEALMSSQQGRNVLRPLFRRAIKNGAIYGTVIFKVLWEEEVRRVRRKLPGKSPLEPFTVQDNDEVVYAGPQPRLCDLFNVWVHPLTANSIDEAECIIERFERTEGQLRAMERRGVYANVGELLRKQPGSSSDSSANLDARNHDAGLESSAPSGKYVIYEYWGRFVLPREVGGKVVNEECEAVITLGENAVVLRVQRNPFWHGRRPYVAARWDSVEGEFYGISAIEPVAKLQLEINDTRNQTMDARTFALNPVLLAGQQSGLKEGDLILYPGRTLQPTDINQIKPLDIPDVTQTGLEGESRAKDDMDEASGMNDVLSGQANINRTPGTSVSTMVDESSVPINGVADNMWDEAFAPYLKMCWSLNEQFQTRPAVVKAIGIPGLKWVNVDPAHVMGRYDFAMLGREEMATRVSRGQQLIQLLQQAQGIVQVTGDPTVIDFREGLRRAFELVGEEAVDRIVPDAQIPGGEDPMDENEAVLQGVMPEVHPDEDFMAHLTAHQALYDDPGFAEYASEEVVSLLGRHIQETIRVMSSVGQQPGVSPGGGSSEGGMVHGPYGGSDATREEGQLRGGAIR